jgi:hypothetical protein
MTWSRSAKNRLKTLRQPLDIGLVRFDPFGSALPSCSS